MTNLVAGSGEQTSRLLIPRRADPRRADPRRADPRRAEQHAQSACKAQTAGYATANLEPGIVVGVYFGPGTVSD